MTKAMLDQLRAQRRKASVSLEYTIGGAIQSQVNATVERERERTIANGEEILRSALEEFRREQSLSAHRGMSKSHFNHAHEDIKP